MPSFPKFGENLADAQRRIGAIPDREASVKVRANAESGELAKASASNGSATEVQDRAQGLVPPDTKIVGPEVVVPRDTIGFQLPLTLGSHEAKVTVLNIDPGTAPLSTPLPLDVVVELRVKGIVVETLTFNELLAFGNEVTNATRVTIRDGRADGLTVSIVVNNRSRYAVQVGAQFEREFEL